MGILLRWQQPPVESSWDRTDIQTSPDNSTWSDLTSISDITTTSYYDESGTSSTYYRIRFYNTSAITGTPWSTGVLGDAVGGYCTVQELRKFLQFGRSNNPSTEDMSFFIQQSKTRLDGDLLGSETDAKKKLLHLFLGAAFVMRGLARRALRFGYIDMQVEGGTVHKSYNELIDEAERDEEQYNIFLNKDATEAKITTPIGDSEVDSDTDEDIRNIYTGVSDAEDYEDSLANTYRRRRRG